MDRGSETQLQAAEKKNTLLIALRVKTIPHTQRQTAVTTHLKSKQLLLFAFSGGDKNCSYVCPGNDEIWLLRPIT